MNVPLKFCPRCGEETWTAAGNHRTCTACDFTLYFNAAAAVAAIITCDGHILASVRARDPGARKRDLPGGFADFGESAETALRRELLEELKLKEFAPTYFGTYPNRYHYKDFDYHTLDVVFTVPLNARPDFDLDPEIAATEWIPTAQLDIDAFAFASIRACLADYLIRSELHEAAEQPRQ